MPSLLSEYGKRFEDWMVEMFYQYGLLLGKHPFWFLWGPLIFTACCTPGLFYLKINLDLYKLFVPTDAPVVFKQWVHTCFEVERHDFQVRYEFERGQEFNRMPNGDLSSAPGKKPNQPKRVPRDDRFAFMEDDFEMERLRRDLELMMTDQDHVDVNITRFKRQAKMDPRKEEMTLKKAQKKKSTGRKRVALRCVSRQITHNPFWWHLLKLFCRYYRYHRSAPYKRNVL